MSPGDPRMLTISHQYGSGGSQIARDLGGRLQWPVWEKEIVRKIATEYQLAETDVDAKTNGSRRSSKSWLTFSGWADSQQPTVSFHHEGWMTPNFCT
jgi:hypothetical protein